MKKLLLILALFLFSACTQAPLETETITKTFDLNATFENDNLTFQYPETIDVKFMSTYAIDTGEKYNFDGDYGVSENGMVFILSKP